ncbi:MAG: hypothetical protein AB1716_19375 [Planctomycetota bacterium]
MIQHTGAQLGLLAFTVAILAGLYAGNSATVVLTRALLVMLAGAVVGQLAGWAAKTVLRDHLQRKKLEIDRRHFEAVRGLSGEPPAAAPEARSGEVG